MKKVVSFVLVLLMALTLLPTTVWAGGYENYAAYDVSVWEDSADPINCSESNSGKGWSYDKEAAILTLNGFAGKYITIGKPMTILLKAGSVNDIAYGLYFGTEYKKVTIAGAGKLKVGNAIESSYTDIIISAEVEIEKRELPSFQANIAIADESGEIFTTRAVELAGDGAYTGYTGLILPFGDTLTMQGGSLTVTGTEYGLKARAGNKAYNQHNISGGTVRIVDTTVSAVCIDVDEWDFEADQLSTDPSVVVKGAKAVDRNDCALIWKAVQDQYGRSDVQLYSAEGAVAKSATIAGTASAGEKTVVGFAVLSEQPFVLIEGLDAFLTYEWDFEKEQEDTSKPFMWYNLYALSKTLVIRAVYSDGTVKVGTMHEIDEMTESGDWHISADGGNSYENQWMPGHTYTARVMCSNKSGQWSSNEPSVPIQIKIIPKKVGDIDGDGETTVLEVQAIYEWLTTQGSLTESQRSMLDMNGDRVLDVFDLQYCYEVAAKIKSVPAA